MSALQMSERIGQHAVWCGSDLLAFEVRIIDATRAYGRVRFLITPVAGTGTKWVDGEKLRLGAVRNASD